MKKIITLFLVVALLFCFSGCVADNTDMAKPVTVYYCQKKIDYGSDMGLIAPDQIDFGDWNGRMLAFMNFYISAPVKEGMYSPFPAGASINAIEYRNEILKVQLNPLFSRLSACELTVACACISLTLFELTSASSVSFSFHSGTNETIAVMTRDNLIFKDLSVNN